MRIHEGIQLWKHDWCVAGKLFLGMLCSKVMMLVVLMMTALTNTFAYDQWHLSAADIEVGKPYWISFVAADHKNLSTEQTSVTNFALILHALTDSTWEFFPTLLFKEKSTRLYKMYCL